MTQVMTMQTAEHFRPRIADGIFYSLHDCAPADGFAEARPARSRFKFIFTTEERLFTGDVIIRSLPLLSEKFLRKGALRAAFAVDAVLLGREALGPFGVADGRRRYAIILMDKTAKKSRFGLLYKCLKA